MGDSSGSQNFDPVDISPVCSDVDLNFDGGSNIQKTMRLCSSFINGVTPPGDYSDMHQLFMQRIDDLQENDISQITDLTNSLPKGENDTAQSLLARLGYHNLESELDRSVDQNQKLLMDGSLFMPNMKSNEDASEYVPPCKMENMAEDVYGRVTYYEDKLVLQLRYFNHHTNYPVNVTKCWLCKEKITSSGTQLYSHKHALNGVFQINDEFIQMDIGHQISEDTLPLTMDDATPTKPCGLSIDRSEFETYECSSIQDRIDHSDKSLSISTDKVINKIVENKPMKCLNPSDKDCLSSISNLTKENAALGTKSGNYIDEVCSDSNQTISQTESLNLKKNQSGAKKRKSKPQKKLSVIQMSNDKGDVDYNSTSSISEIPLTNWLETDEQSPTSPQISIPDNIKFPIEFLDPALLSSSDDNENTSHIDNKQHMESSSSKQQNSTTSSDDENISKLKNNPLTSSIDKFILNKCLELRCRNCGEEFDSNITNYITHMKKYGLSDSELFYCYFCHKTFKGRKYLLRHTLTHTTRPKLQCGMCDRSYIHEDKLQRHILTFHSQEHPFKCWLCSKSFKRKDNLRHHEAIHNNTKLQCNMCELQCSTSLNLEIHMKSHSDKILMCDKCPKTFVEEDILSKHVKEFHDKIKFDCETCGKTFSRKDALKRHINVHTLQSFDCLHCNKKFTRKDRLAFHIKTHKNMNQFKCTECPSIFTRKEVLKKHQRIHKFKENCNICSKSFTSKTLLLYHHVKHEKQKAKLQKQNKFYSCSLCEDKFNRKIQLARHIKLAHNSKGNLIKRKIICRNKEFTCEICSEKFTRRCTLKSHIASVHDPLNTKQFDRSQSLYDNRPMNNIHQICNQENNFNNRLNIASNSSPPEVPFPETSLGSELSTGTSSTYQPSEYPGNIPVSSESAINLSTEAITAAVYLLTYPSYAGPYSS